MARSTRTWLLPAVFAAVLGALVIAGAVTGQLTPTTQAVVDLVAPEPDATASPTEPDLPEYTALHHARRHCFLPNSVLSDDEHTMILDGQGTDFGSGTTSVETMACVLAEIGTPSHVAARIDATRALDGMQDTEWDGFEASWTYHPDNGLDLIIVEVS